MKSFDRNKLKICGCEQISYLNMTSNPCGIPCGPCGPSENYRQKTSPKSLIKACENCGVQAGHSKDSAGCHGLCWFRRVHRWRIVVHWIERWITGKQAENYSLIRARHFLLYWLESIWILRISSIVTQQKVILEFLIMRIITVSCEAGTITLHREWDINVFIFPNFKYI